MFTWLTFANACIFLLIGSILFATSNIFQLTLAAELVWVALMVFSAVVATFIDDAGVFSLTFFILGLAAIELSFGLILMSLMRHFKLSIFVSKNYKKISVSIMAYLAKQSAKKKI